MTATLLDEKHDENRGVFGGQQTTSDLMSRRQFSQEENKQQRDKSKMLRNKAKNRQRMILNPSYSPSMNKDGSASIQIEVMDRSKK